MKAGTKLWLKGLVLLIPALLAGWCWQDSFFTCRWIGYRHLQTTSGVRVDQIWSVGYGYGHVDISACKDIPHSKADSDWLERNWWRDARPGWQYGGEGVFPPSATGLFWAGWTKFSWDRSTTTNPRYARSGTIISFPCWFPFVLMLMPFQWFAYRKWRRLRQAKYGAFPVIREDSAVAGPGESRQHASDDVRG